MSNCFRDAYEVQNWKLPNALLVLVNYFVTYYNLVNTVKGECTEESPLKHWNCVFYTLGLCCAVCTIHSHVFPNPTWSKIPALVGALQMWLQYKWAITALLLDDQPSGHNRGAPKWPIFMLCQGSEYWLLGLREIWYEIKIQFLETFFYVINVTKIELF